MKLPPDPALLARVRQQPCCWCGRPAPSEAAHVHGKGMGGWRRYDLECNVVPLCREDHQASHDGHHPTTADLLAIAAARCGTTQDRIRDAIYRLRRAPKGTDPATILRRLQHGRGSRVGEQVNGNPEGIWKSF